ncbi:deoxynucleoside kinase [Pseudomonas sp. EA_35y_Pfl2_R5]|uniref:deoxynucleoside kinase n=1 Tax=Pseudomonas sp. EA_35y_Pfl2_R5 TaxID=3088690 RepID=UPI0030DA4D80
MFIALEGCDGVGKSTVRQILRKVLERRDIPCLTIGQHSWLSPWDAFNIVTVREQRARIPDAVIAASYRQDKKMHGLHNVTSMLDCGVVIADRWIYSDAAYHEALYSIAAEQTLENHRSQNTLIPDIVIYVSVDVDEAYRRILSRGRNTKHYERPVDLQKICQSYHRIFFEEKLAYSTQVLVFDNTLGDVEDRVLEFTTQNLLPLILAREEPTPPKKFAAGY